MPLVVLCGLLCGLLAGCVQQSAEHSGPVDWVAAHATPTPTRRARPTPTPTPTALTFDADMTPEMWARLESGRVKSYANVKIIDLLEEESVPATFFLTGMWVKRYPELTHRLADNPRFELANHILAGLRDKHWRPVRLSDLLRP